MAFLTIYELRKRDNYAIFLNKIKTGQPFELIKNKKETLKRDFIVLTPEQDLLERLQRLQNTPGDNPEAVLERHMKNKCLLLKTTEGVKITSGYLQKTWEFGSRASEVVYDKETRHQKHIQGFLKKATIFGLKSISLSIETTNKKTITFNNIFSVRPPVIVNGERRKTDFEFLDKSGNVVFRVSHKDGKDPTDFRQWSGLKEFSQHPEVIQFGADLKEYLNLKHPTETIFPIKLSVGREIKDENLKRQSIFGGTNEVDFLIQGHCSFKWNGFFNYTLRAPLILSKQEDLSLLPSGYHPILLAKKGDIKRTAFGIKCCRSMIYSRNGRKVHVSI